MMSNFPTTLKVQPHQINDCGLIFCKNQPADHCNKSQEKQDQILYENTEIANSLLSDFCQMRLPDLNSDRFQDKYRTLEIILFLIKQRTKIIQSNIKLNSYRRKSDQYLLEKEEMLQKISKQQRAISNQKQLLVNKKQSMERLYKQNNQKLLAQKDDLNKQLKKIQARQKAYEAEFRKKENHIKLLQDGIKKIQERSHSKNHFQIIQKVNDSRSKVKISNGIDQYNKVTLFQIQESLKNITKENNFLKRLLCDIQKQLNGIFEIVNCKIKLQSQQYDIDNKMLRTARPEIFKSYFQSNHGKVEELLQNLEKLKIFIEQINEEKNKNLGDVTVLDLPNNYENHKIKDLLQNFKQIVKSQDQVLNKIILKSQDFMDNTNKINEQKCCKALDNIELDRIKDLIQNQMSYIQSKNKQLSTTKQKLNRDLVRAQKIKSEIIQQRLSIFTSTL